MVELVMVRLTNSCQGCNKCNGKFAEHSPFAFDDDAVRGDLVCR